MGHYWAPITDLGEHDLPPLARMWQNIRGELDPVQVHDFNERLKREWAIETGIIERLYTLDRGTTQLLIEQGIDASLIASDATDQPSELIAGMIQDHLEAVDWLFDVVTQTASAVHLVRQAVAPAHDPQAAIRYRLRRSSGTDMTSSCAAATSRSGPTTPPARREGP